MPQPQSTMHFLLPTAPLPNTNTTTFSTCQVQPQAQTRLSQVPLPYPVHNPEIQAWLQNHEPHVGGLVFIFVFLLALSGLWRSRADMMKWCSERSQEEERRKGVERERERKKRRSVVVVGILRGGRNWRGGDGGGRDGKRRGMQRVRFLGVDGLDDESPGEGGWRLWLIFRRTEALLGSCSD
ncbi:hypothetical protein BKA64DRAFT_768917 [Cadophora sp. MPI-SDFR-AT-0126]|nr:hypothetical protein BKA64DRAFT_768917 [Leotiomycetes sp. MPI-SDFR-AT-0126]